MRRKYGVILGAAFVLLLVLFAAAVASAAKIHTVPKLDQRVIDKLLDESLGDREVRINPGRTRIIELNGRFPIDKDKAIPEAVLDFIGRHREAFGLKNPVAELRALREDNGHILFEQVYNGVPVWGKQLGATVVNGEIVNIKGDNAPTPGIDTTPLLTPEEAVGKVRDDKTGGRNEVVNEPTTLVIYISRKGRYYLAYLVHGQRLNYFVDAMNGKILSRSNN
jgi:hypothetical protein